MLYRNKLKNREFDKEALQNFDLERATIALEQGASEDLNFEGKPTPSKTDSSVCFGIKPEKILPTEQGMFFDLNGIDYIPLVNLHSDARGCYVQAQV